MSSSMPCCLAVLTNSDGNSSRIAPRPPIFVPRPLPTRPISQASMATRNFWLLVGMCTSVCSIVHRRTGSCVLPVSAPIIPINTPEVEESFGGAAWPVAGRLVQGCVCAITTAGGPHDWPAIPAHHPGARPGGAPGRHAFSGRLIRRRVCRIQSGPQSAAESSMAL